MEKPRVPKAAIFLGVSGLVALGLVAWLLVDLLVAQPLARRTETLDTRVGALEKRVQTLQGLLDAAQNQNNDLRSQVEGSILTLQDVYFEQLKKNDGLSAVWTDPRPGRRAYLTFDDGPTENTALILDALKAQKALATFFVNGRSEGKALYQRIVREGHRLGNHTYSHDYNLIYRSVAGFMQDTDRLDAYLASLGLAPSKIYRFPGGAKNEIAARIGGPDLTGKISAAMADRGYRFFEWNVAVGDGESKPDNLQYAPNEIRKSIAAQVKSKRIAVILLHDGPGHQATARAVPGILADLKKSGFTLEALP